MARYGKPIKNKKHVDPRYFLHENQERLDEFLPGGDFKMPSVDPKMFKMLCDNKDMVIAAINSPPSKGAVSKLMALGDAFGMVSRETKILMDTIAQLAQVDSIDELIQDPYAKQMIVMVLEFGCPG
tara:strand:- start:270 stop:647 length:378 start_codon:yes stop_codon:yes gene_type:complete